MKITKLKIIAPVAMSMILAGCGGASGNSATSNNATTTTQNTSLGETLLGSIAQNVINNNKQNTETTNSSTDSGSTISALIGKLTNALTSSASIVGTWSYSKPVIQFESENLLAKAGGSLASQSVVNKIEPYYKKLGIDSGTITFVFNENGTCTYSFKGKEYQGSYTYDKNNNKIVITSSTGINIINAFVTVGANEMAITFDTSKLLDILQKASSLTTNSTITALSSLSSSFNGMKTGFLFTKK